MRERKFNEDLTIGVICLISAVISAINYSKTYLDGFLINTIFSFFLGIFELHLGIKREKNK